MRVQRLEAIMPRAAEHAGDLLVAELFGPTFQGEGPSAGQQALFVRLSRCNLSCRWCDTSYTWDWSRFDPHAEARRLPVPEVARWLLQWPVRLVVVTDGTIPPDPELAAAVWRSTSRRSCLAPSFPARAAWSVGPWRSWPPPARRCSSLWSPRRRRHARACRGGARPGLESHATAARAAVGGRPWPLNPPPPWPLLVQCPWAAAAGHRCWLRSRAWTAAGRPR